MDPVGSWSAYQSAYNRIAVASAYSTTEFQHHLTSANTPSSSSTTLYSPNGQLIHPSSTNQSFVQHSTNNTSGDPSHTSNISSAFNPNSFLSPPPVGHHNQVFPTIYHPHPAKASSSYYRPAPNNAKTIQPDSSTNYPTSQNYIEQVNPNLYNLFPPPPIYTIYFFFLMYKFLINICKLNLPSNHSIKVLVDGILYFSFYSTAGFP